MLGTKTYFPKESQREIKWYLVDADGKILGRLATQIANLLRGKHHPTFTPHADGGFRVAVVNTENIQVTGNKAEQKFYYRHSGYPGGIKQRTFNEQMERKPEVVLRQAGSSAPGSTTRSFKSLKPASQPTKHQNLSKIY